MCAYHPWFRTPIRPHNIFYISLIESGFYSEEIKMLRFGSSIRKPFGNLSLI